jgi:asparagine synthetase B (glutamine-hydrolysing)
MSSYVWIHRERLFSFNTKPHVARRRQRQHGHRGPDASEWWSAIGSVGLAHRRLEITVLSPGSHPPMHEATRGLAIYLAVRFTTSRSCEPN